MGKLTNQEAAAGWTDEITIDWGSFAVAAIGTVADDTDYTFTYTIPAGTQIRHVGARLNTAFNDSGGGDELDVVVGDGSDADGFLTILQLHTDGTPMTYAADTGVYIDNENGKVYTTADTIDIVFSPNTSTGQSYSVNELTAGSITFRFDMVAI